MSTIVPIVDVGTLKAAGWKGIDGLADDVMAQCLLSATAEIERICAPRRFAQATYTAEPYSGSSAVGRYGHMLYLDQYPVTTMTLVQENGTTLLVGMGYDAAGTKNALLLADKGILLRKSGSVSAQWAPGLLNIPVTYAAGYVDPASEIADLVHACINLAILHFKSSRRQGQESSARQGGTVTFAELSEMDQQTIQRYAGHGRPRLRLAA